MAVTNPRSVESVFEDFKGRRIALIKALTDDADKLFEKRDPEMGNLCLCGYPDGTWKVHLPVEVTQAGLPELGLGSNKFWDEVPKTEWLSAVAHQSDSWLLTVALNLSACHGFGKSDRRRLFEMINDLPSVFDIVNAPFKTSRGQSINHKNSKTPCEPEHPNPRKLAALPNSDYSQDLCSTCGDFFPGFWIQCDTCTRWFHGLCVNMNPAKAELFEQYECHICRNNKRESLEILG